MAGSERSEGDFEDEMSQERKKKNQLMRESRFFSSSLCFYLFYSNMLTLQSIYLLALHTIISVYYSVSSTHLASKCSHSFLWIKKVLLFLLIQFSCSSLILSDMKWRNILRKFTSWPPFYIHLSFMRNWYGSSYLAL